MVLVTSMGLLAQGSTWETATLISSGQTKTGTLDATTTDAWYKINVTQEGTIDFTLTASGGLTFYRSWTQVHGYWQGALRAWGNFSGELYTDNLTFKATNAGKGTYYIRINRSGGSGTFTLKYKFTRCPLNNDPEPNNDYEHASLLQSGTTTQARLGYRTADDVTDNDDWYKIVVPEEGKVELIATATEDLKFYRSWTQVHGYWQDAISAWGNFSGELYTDSLNFTATNVGKGTYYIRINRSGGSGGYRLKYTFTPCPLAADPEPNNDYEHATLLQSGTTQARLGYRTSDNVTDNDDWYKIVVPEDGRIELVATATEDLKFYRSWTQVYGYWQDAPRAWGDFSGELYTDTLKFTATNVAKGTYYIRIYHNSGSGGYRLKYTFTPCPLENDFEPNNDYQHYNRLISGKTTEAHLGYRTSDNVTDNEDWYRINVPTDGDIELVATATEDLTFYRSGSYVYIYRDDNIYGFGGFSASELYSPTLTFTATNVAKGTYYIRIVRGGGSSGYTMRYNGPASEISGDVDGDGIVNISDVAELTDILLSGSGEYLPNGDADGDGRITIADVTEIVDMLTGN